MTITRETDIRYFVTPYSGKAYVFFKKKDALAKFKEESLSDPSLMLLKTTRTEYIETEQIK